MSIRLLLYALLFIVVHSSTYGNCPYKCDCQPHDSVPSRWKVDCEWESLRDDSPFSVSSSIRSLSIHCSSSSIQSITSSTFKGLNDLHQLKIENCGINGIDGSAFNHLNELRELILIKISSNDSVLNIPEESLLPLNRLQTFQLSDSRLEVLPSSFFCTLSHLQMLNVSGNNLKSSSLSSNSACYAAHLIIADLSRNQLGEILSNTFDVFPAVRQLLLGFNSITSMHSLSFNKTRLLQQLDIEGNGLTTIGVLPDTLVSLNGGLNEMELFPSSISSLPHLVFLNLSHNNLISVPLLETTDIESIDLSYNGLRSIPKLWNESSSSSIHHLHLSHNKIVSLSNGGLLSQLNQLQTLDLSHNSISSIEDGIMNGLSSLSSLLLHHNSISYLSPSSLSNLVLDSINLSHNKLTKVPISLSRMSKCKSIDLSSNSIGSISHHIFSKISQLTKLDLSHNKLEKISQYEVSECTHLTSLSLNSNELREISPLSFTQCSSLRRLDVSSNRLPSISISSSSINSLRRLNISFNLLGSLEWEGIPSKVEYLHADYNRLTSFKGNPSNHRIRILSLSHNGLTSLSSSSLPDSLESFDVSSNSLSFITPSTFSSKASLTSLNLTWNSLSSLSLDSIHVPDALTPLSLSIKGNPFDCLCNMDWMKSITTSQYISIVDLSHTQCTHLVDKKKINMTEIDRKQMLCNYTKMCEPGCICCQFSSCDCKSECPRGCECWRDGSYTTNVVRCNALRGSDIDKFNIRDIPMSSTHIHISDFPLEVLKQHSFLGRSKLLHLHINNTKLRLIEPMAFNKAVSLQLLDLSRNELRDLRADSFFRTTNITHLFLDHNMLERVDDDMIKKLNKLKAITLHNNNLMNIPSSLSLVQSLTLSSNPFRCDCNPYRFLTPSFIHSYSHKIHDVGGVHCIENVTRAFRQNDTTILSAFPPNRDDDIYDMSMTEFIREMNTSICIPISTGIFGSESQDSYLIILLILFILLLSLTCIILIIAAIRKNSCGRNQKRYKLNSSSLNCSTCPGTSPLPVPLLGYDVFISYSLKDEKMVNEKLIRHLEGDYNLCLLHRDGPKYDTLRHAVSDELTNLMRSSNTIIMVITKNFLENEWLSTQIKISHKLVSKDKSQFLAIFGDDVDMNSLDEQLGQILRKKERIRFNDHLYHNTLQNALPLPSRSSPSSDNTSQIYYELGGIIVPSAIV